MYLQMSYAEENFATVDLNYDHKDEARVKNNFLGELAYGQPLLDLVGHLTQ